MATLANTSTATTHDSGDDDVSVTLSFKQRLQTAMNQSTNAPVPITTDSLASDKKLLNAIIRDGLNCSTAAANVAHFYTLYTLIILLTVPPTSVEAERAFSAAGLFVTKLRSRLGDQSIDTLFFACILRTKNAGLNCYLNLLNDHLARATV